MQCKITTVHYPIFTAGFVESLCEQLKGLHLKLTMEVLDGPQLLLQQQNGKKDGHPIVNQVVLTLDLLRNFMFNNTDVKVLGVR